MQMTFKMNKTQDVLEVTEFVQSGAKTNTKHWYIDIRIWFKNKLGLKDEPVSEKMTQEQIDWVTNKWLPKVNYSGPLAIPF